MIDQYVYTFLTTNSTISAITSTRAYPQDGIPAKPTYDLISYGAESHSYTKTYDGQNGHCRSDYFIDAWSQTHANAIVLANAIRTEMKNLTGDFGGITVQQIHIDSGPFFVYEYSVEAYRATQIFSIWHTEG